MKIFMSSAVFLTAILFFAACGSTRTNEQTYQTGESPRVLQTNVNPNNDYWARDNFNLPAVGDVLRRSDSAADFERRINSGNDINNLDLNGDGYADYISVAEYQDPDTGYRGFSLFDKFGGDAIQGIATIILDRTLNGGRDTRVYLDGNDQIYGNEYFYQADWKDTASNIVKYAFQNRNDNYQSPYYYDNYPSDYETYRIVETPVYTTRIEQNYSQPGFIKTDPGQLKYKVKSPYADKYYDKIYGRLAEPNDSQKEFKKNNPNPPEFVPNQREKVKNLPPGQEKKLSEKERGEDRDDRSDFDRDRKDSNDKSGKSKPKKMRPEKDDRGRGNDGYERGNEGGKDKEKGKGGGNGKGKGGKGKG